MDLCRDTEKKNFLSAILNEKLRSAAAILGENFHALVTVWMCHSRLVCFFFLLLKQSKRNLRDKLISLPKIAPTLGLDFVRLPIVVSERIFISSTAQVYFFTPPGLKWEESRLLTMGSKFCF